MSARTLFTTTSLLSVEDNEYFVINAQTRVITLPTGFTNFGVESDENSNRVYFKCPRYVGDNLDLTTLNLRVNYQNANGDKDKYLVTDVTVDGENVVFSWLLSRKATMYSGVLSFIVCAVKTGSNGVIVNEWNTTLCRGDVLGGLEVENPEITEEVSDLISQLVDLVDDSISNVETVASESVANVKTAEAQAIEAVTNAPNSLFANAIKGSASGEIIRLNDVSPVEHMVGVKVSGKNLFNISQLTSTSINDTEYATRGYISKVSTNAVTITTKDGHSSNGYTVTWKTLKQLCPSLQVGDIFILGAVTESANKYIYLSVPYANAIMFNVAYVATKEMLDSSVILYGFNVSSGKQGVGDCVISNIQIELGNTVTEYEPYIDPSTVTLTVQGGDESSVVTYTPDSEGKVNGVSVAPTMQLFTDTEGVTIECEYTRDTNVVIADLIKRVAALESGV